MEQTYNRQDKPSIRVIHAALLVTLSVIMSLLSIYLFHSTVWESTQVNYTQTEKEIASIFACISLPLALLIMSQLLIKWRGLHGGVWAFFWGALIMLLAQAPSMLALN